MSNLTDIFIKDIPACAKIFTDVYSGPPWDYHWVTIDKADRYMRDIAASPGFCGFVYFEDDVLTGFCVGAMTDYFFGPQYEIKECAIIPDRQRNGAGSRMISLIEDRLAKAGVINIYLHTSRTIPAYGFYIKNGYLPVDDNVYFMKELKNPA